MNKAFIIFNHTQKEVFEMATDKTFKVFGTSKLNGEYKVRFANDTMRVKVLEKHGHEDVILVELSESLTKYDGIKAIQGMDQFANASSQMAITEYLDEKAPKAKVSKPVATATKTPATKVVKAPAKSAKVTEDLDAPF
jgi:phage FluMu gp28-like protein